MTLGKSYQKAPGKVMIETSRRMLGGTRGRGHSGSAGQNEQPGYILQARCVRSISGDAGELRVPFTYGELGVPGEGSAHCLEAVGGWGVMPRGGEVGPHS